MLLRGVSWEGEGGEWGGAVGVKGGAVWGDWGGQRPSMIRGEFSPVRGETASWAEGGVAAGGWRSGCGRMSLLSKKHILSSSTLFSCEIHSDLLQPRSAPVSTPG